MTPKSQYPNAAKGLRGALFEAKTRGSQPGIERDAELRAEIAAAVGEGWPKAWSDLLVHRREKARRRAVAAV